MTLIFFFFGGGGGGWRGEMENCAYLRKNPGYAPVHYGTEIFFLTEAGDQEIHWVHEKDWATLEIRAIC